MHIFPKTAQNTIYSDNKFNKTQYVVFPLYKTRRKVYTVSHADKLQEAGA